MLLCYYWLLNVAKTVHFAWHARLEQKPGMLKSKLLLVLMPLSLLTPARVGP